MNSNDREILQYIMNAIDEGVSTVEIRKEVSRLAKGGSVIDAFGNELKERMLGGGVYYETI